MRFWNFRTPISFLASCLWNFAEAHKIYLPKSHIIFGLMMQSKGKRLK